MDSHAAPLRLPTQETRPSQSKVDPLLPETMLCQMEKGSAACDKNSIHDAMPYQSAPIKTTNRTSNQSGGNRRYRRNLKGTLTGKLANNSSMKLGCTPGLSSFRVATSYKNDNLRSSRANPIWANGNITFSFPSIWTLFIALADRAEVGRFRPSYRHQYHA